MNIEAILDLEDRPGTLLSVLSPISENEGNVVAITHMREKTRDNCVPTIVHFKVRDLEHLDKIRAGLKKNKIRIRELKINGRQLIKKKSFSVLILGHVMKTDARDTIDKITVAGGYVSHFVVNISQPEDPSASILNIEVEEKEFPKIMNLLNRIAKEKDLKIITEI